MAFVQCLAGPIARVVAGQWRRLEIWKMAGGRPKRTPHVSTEVRGIFRFDDLLTLSGIPAGRGLKLGKKHQKEKGPCLDLFLWFFTFIQYAA